MTSEPDTGEAVPRSRYLKAVRALGAAENERARLAKEVENLRAEIEALRLEIMEDQS